MRMHLLQDAASLIFTKQLLDMGKGKLQFDLTIREVYFLPIAWQMQSSIKNVEQKVFLNIENNCKNHNWLC
jgi:hypothetical protein